MNAATVGPRRTLLEIVRRIEAAGQLRRVLVAREYDRHAGVVDVPPRWIDQGMTRTGAGAAAEGNERGSMPRLAAHGRRVGDCGLGWKETHSTGAWERNMAIRGQEQTEDVRRGGIPFSKQATRQVVSTSSAIGVTRSPQDGSSARKEQIPSGD